MFYLIDGALEEVRNVSILFGFQMIFVIKQFKIIFSFLFRSKTIWSNPLLLFFSTSSLYPNRHFLLVTSQREKNQIKKVKCNGMQQHSRNKRDDCHGGRVGQLNCSVWVSLIHSANSTTPANSTWPNIKQLGQNEAGTSLSKIDFLELSKVDVSSLQGLQKS